MSGDEKVIVNNINPESGGRSGGDGVGGLGAMAAIAALGNRNSNNGGDGFGLGGGGLGGLLALALLGGNGFGGRDFGRRDGGNDCCEGLGFQAVLGKLGSIEAAVPLSALQVQNSIQEQTIGLNTGLSALALGTQQGFANTKDAVQASTGALAVAIAGTKDAIQNGLFLTNTNLLEGVCSIKAAVQADGAETRALLVSRFQLEDQTRITTLANELAELRNDGRHRDTANKIEITNTAIAAQAQGQQQAQFQGLVQTVNSFVPCLQALIVDNQIARATNSNVIVGNTGASTVGAQTASPTNVRA